ncbi:MAG: glutamate racemase, partial [Bacteroidales bacterium]
LTTDSMQPSQPIGIFDSGVGGLTVANAIRQILPDEQMIYFGDTFHLPYGDKSADSVKFYSTRISEYLLSLNCKLILIACNTASALAWEAVSETVRGKALAMNVIDPVIDEVAGNTKIKRIGVIGTKGTINSGTYKLKLIQKNNRLDVRSLATPLLVPMIEEGFIFDDISNAIIRNYLSREELQGIDTLILGCTHYPIIKQQIARFFDFRVQIVDSAVIVAKRLRKLLRENNLLNKDSENPVHQFLVSDYTEYFEIIARMFFEGDIRLQKIDLWSHS